MITLARLRQVLATPPEKDPEVELIRLQVLAQWDTLTKRSWAFQAGRVEKVYPEGCSLYLSKFPITVITLVRERAKGSTTWSTVTKYEQIGKNELENLGGNWNEVVEVTYSAGYTDVTVPADIRQALEIQARFLTERTSDGKLIVRSQNFEGGGGVYEDAFYHPYFKKTAEHNIRRV